MAKITVQIEANNLWDFRAVLRGLIEGTGTPDAEAAPETADAEPEPAKPARSKKAAESKQPEPATAPKSVAETQDAAPVPAAEEVKITHEDLRDAMQSLKASVSRRLVAEFSGKAPEDRPRLSDVPPEKYAGMMAEAKRLSQLPENIKQEKTDD